MVLWLYLEFFNTGCIIYLCVIYIQEFHKNKEVRTRLLTARSDSKLHSFLVRISFYPCVFLITSFAMLTGRLVGNIYSNDGESLDDIPTWVPYAVQCAFLEGFFCSIAYGFTPSLRSQYRKLFRRVSSTTTLQDDWSAASFADFPQDGK